MTARGKMGTALVAVGVSRNRGSVQVTATPFMTLLTTRSAEPTLRSNPGPSVGVTVTVN